MRKTTTVFLLMTLAAAVFAANGRFDIKNIRFHTRFTPVPKYENADSRSKVAKRTRWLCVETTFIPEARDAQQEPWYDDVTMEGMLVITRADGKGISYVVLTGKTRFFTIPADGKNHTGMFYVPPQLLLRYLSNWNGDLAGIQMARVSFYAPGKILLGEGYWAALGGNAKGKFIPIGSKEHRTVAARMKEYEKNYSNITMLRGGLYSKENTPWVYFSYDLYDLIYDLKQDNGSIKQ